MGYKIENGATPTIVFVLVDSTDDETAETGLTPTVEISKNGGAFAATTNAAAEISNGFYKIDLTATETGADGPLALLASGAGTNIFRDIYNVESPSEQTLTTAERTAIATEIMEIDLSDIEDDAEVQTSGSVNLARLIAKELCKAEFVGTRLDIYETDGTTVLFSQSGTSTSSPVDLVGLGGAA